MLAGDEAGRPLFHREEGGTFGRHGQHGVQRRDSAVRNELLGAVDLVTFDFTVLHHPLGLGADGGKLAAGQGLGNRVRDNQALVADALKPMIALLLGGPHHDGIGAKEDGEERGGHAQIQAGHGLGHAVHVVRRPAETAQILGDEEQVHADIWAQ